ncbi:MAG: DUF4249 domain-containing protein [Bacteroidetes bacterium]|nr:MAG: DUF4249 domain-containing protein [Bacteroidota bacterium]
MKQPNYIFVLIAVLFSACWEKADVPLPRQEPKMVLAAFLSPEDTFRVYLTNTNPIQAALPDSPNFITNAMVFLSDGQDTVQLQTDPIINKAYVLPNSSFPILPGKTYYLQAKANGYPSISAKCTVPKYKLPAQGVVTNVYRYSTGGSDTLTNIWHTWIDLAGSKDYYRINNWIIDSNRVLNTMNDFQLSAGAGEFVSDVDQDGGKLEMRMDRFGGASIEFGVDRYMVSYIMSVDENYYRYHLSIFNYSGDLPFGFQENIYTNVSGGLGIFAAYRKDIKRVLIK